MRRNDASTLWVPLAEIRISERGTRSVSSATAERYREWLEQGREAPAIRVARIGDAYVVRDGRHRVAAALAAGHRFIEAEVRPRARLMRLLSSIVRLSGRCSPTVRSEGTRFFRKNTSLAPRRSGFDSHRLHQASVVSTASTRPLYG